MAHPRSKMSTVYKFALLFWAGAVSITGQKWNQLKGKHLNVIAVNLPPIMIIRVDKNGNRTYSGPMYEHLDWLSKRLRFSYTLIQEERNFIGVKVNDSWSGLIGLLAAKKVDLAAFPFVLTLERTDALEHVGFFSGDNVALLTRYPTAQVSSTSVFRPYSIQSWIAWLVSFVLVIFACICLVLLGPRNISDQRTRFTILNELLIYIYGSFLNQGGYLRGHLHHLGVLVVSWGLAAFVFVNVYNSTLTSALATWYKAPEINSVRDLADSGVFKILTIKGTVLDTEILAAESGPYKKLGDKLRNCPDCRLGPGTLERNILRGQYVAIGNSKGTTNVLKAIYYRSKTCQLTLAFERFGWQTQHLGVPRHSPYVAEIDRESLWAHAFGLPYYWKSFPEEFLPCRLNYNSKGVEVNSSNRPIQLKEISSAFIILLTGSVLAALSFISELICQSHMGRTSVQPVSTRIEGPSVGQE